MADDLTALGNEWTENPYADAPVVQAGDDNFVTGRNVAHQNYQDYLAKGGFGYAIDPQDSTPSNRGPNDHQAGARDEGVHVWHQDEKAVNPFG